MSTELSLDTIPVLRPGAVVEWRNRVFRSGFT